MADPIQNPTTLYGLREWLRASIAASSDIPLALDQILIIRQGDLWNDVATAIAAAENGMVLQIDGPQGRNRDKTGAALDMDLTISLTLLCEPNTDPNQVPEEETFEALLHFIHGLKIPVGPGRPCVFHFLSEGFGELEVPRDYLARQIVVAKRHILQKPTPDPEP